MLKFIAKIFVIDVMCLDVFTFVINRNITGRQELKVTLIISFITGIVSLFILFNIGKKKK